MMVREDDKGVGMSEDVAKILESLRAQQLRQGRAIVQINARVATLESDSRDRKNQHDRVCDQLTATDDRLTQIMSDMSAKLNTLLHHKTEQDAVKGLREKEHEVIKAQVETLLTAHNQQAGADRLKGWLPAIITSIAAIVSVVNSIGG